MTVLTKEMHKDMKQANTLCIHHHDGQTYVRCLFKGEFRGKRVETETRHDLDGPTRYHLGREFEAFVMLDHLDMAGDETATIIECLKVGDELSIEWYPDYGTNGYVFAASGQRGAANSEHEAQMTEEEITAAKRSQYGYGLHESYQGLHADCCRLIVNRGKKRLTFTLDWSVCPDNTARMIREKPETTYSFKTA